MEYESAKNFYRIIKRTYKDETIKFIVQMKTKLAYSKGEWYDLYLKYNTLKDASKAVNFLLDSDKPKYKDEIVS